MRKLASPGRLLRRLRNGVRYDGFFSVALKSFLKLCALVCEVEIEVLLSKDLTQPLPHRTARVPLEIRTASETDLPWIVSELKRQGELGALPNIPTNPAALIEFYHRRLLRGEKLFFACVDGELAHTNWTCFSWAEALTGLPLMLVPGEIYTTDAVTTRRWRGKGIHEVVLNEMLRSAAASGRTRAFTMAEVTNRRSLRGVRRLGWSTYGIALYARPRGTRKVLLLCLRGRLDPLLRSLPAASLRR